MNLSLSVVLQRVHAAESLSPAALDTIKVLALGAQAHRPRQYPAADAAGTPDVCAWPDGLPPVHVYLGDERAAHAGTASEEGKTAVDMGCVNPAGLQPVFAGHQPWWAQNILFVFMFVFVFAGVTQLLALQYRYGMKGLASGILFFPLVAISFSARYCPPGTARFMPRHFFYIAYAGHLLILLILMYIW